MSSASKNAMTTRKGSSLKKEPPLPFGDGAASASSPPPPPEPEPPPSVTGEDVSLLITPT
jgi:hypothetical protein